MANQISTDKLLEKISEHLNIDKHMKERKALHNTRGVITVEEEVKDEETPTPGGDDDDDPDEPDQPVIPDDIKEYLEIAPMALYFRKRFWVNAISLLLLENLVPLMF